MVEEKKVAGSTEVLYSGKMIISAVDVLKWDSEYRIDHKIYKVSDLVEKGLKSKDPFTKRLAEQIEKDTKGEGLMLGFPMANLVIRLKKEKLLKEVV